MSDQKILSKRHSKNGEIILTFDFEPAKHKLIYFSFKFFIQPLFIFLKFISSSLNKTTGRKAYLILSSGLGLGLGLGLIMALSPAQIQADLPHDNLSIGLEIIRIKSTDVGIDTLVKRGQPTVLPLVSLEAPAVHLERSVGIGGGKPIIIQGLNKDYSLYNLHQAQLGDEIFVIGSNDGWYRYTVIETRVVNLEQLNNHLMQLREVVILYTVNPWQKTATMVMARPRT
jgi:hypothetical protein